MENTKSNCTKEITEAIALVAELESAIEREAEITKLREKYPAYSDKVVRQELNRLLKLKKVQKQSSAPTGMGEEFSLPPGVTIPAEYRVTTGGVFVPEFEDGVPVGFTSIMHNPVVVAKKTINNKTKEIGVQLHFLYDGKTRTMNVEQEVIASNTKIMQLSNFGVGVNTNNAPAVVRFLDDQRFASLSCLPEVTTINKSGWSTVGDKLVFAWGEKICSSSDNTVFERQHPLQYGKVFRAWGTAGNFDAWLEIFRWSKEFPIVLFLFGVSLAAPLIELLGLMNFIVHVWENSTAGKTAAAQLGLSVWGCTAPDGLLLSWRTTDNGLEGRLRLNNGLPLCIDDNSQAKNQEVINDVIYMIGNGGTKQRADRKGNARAVHAFHGTALSTGEKPCSSSNTLQGQAVRMLEIKANPFGVRSVDIGNKVRTLKQVVVQNYGHVGERWIKLLVDISNDDDRFNDIKAQYAALREKLVKSIENSYVARTVDHIAAVELALTLVAAAIPELQLASAEIDAAVGAALENQRQVMTDANNIDVKALEYVWNQIISNTNRFTEQHHAVEEWGREVERQDGTKGYGFIPAKLEEILKRGGFNYKASIDYFKTRGWVWKNEKGQLWTFRMEEKFIRGCVFDPEKAIEAEVIQKKSDWEKPKPVYACQNDNVEISF